MNWYKKSQTMFKTFGLEEKLTEAFIQAYNRFYHQYKNYPKIINEKFDDDGYISLGRYNLLEVFKPIIEYYGEPKTKVPEEIIFVIARPNFIKSVNGTVDFGSFFAQTKTEYFIGHVLKNFMKFEIDKDFDHDIGHELQHFLKTLYGNKYLYYTYKYTNPVISYIAEPFEIQGHSYNVARRAIDDIKDLFSIRLDSMLDPSPEKKKRLVEKIKSDKEELVKRFFLFELKKFFEEVNKTAVTDELPLEIKKQYYISALKNFNVFFDQFVKEISSI